VKMLMRIAALDLDDQAPICCMSQTDMHRKTLGNPIGTPDKDVWRPHVLQEKTHTRGTSACRWVMCT
jgi:hypothetical protein